MIKVVSAIFYNNLFSEILYFALEKLSIAFQSNLNMGAMIFLLQSRTRVSEIICICCFVLS